MALSNSTNYLYRHIREGYGGTFPADAPPLMIGTRNCITCVGVYFAVGDRNVFAAHINACIIPDGWNLYSKEHPDHRTPYICEGNEGEILRGMVVARLQKAAHDGGWKPANVHPKRIVMVCPEYNGEPIVGKFVIQAIKEFLSMEDDPVVYGHCHGFAVDPTSEETILMPVSGFPDEAEDEKEIVNRQWEQMIEGQMHKFKALDLAEEDGLEEWQFPISENTVPMTHRKRYKAGVLLYKARTHETD